MFSIDATRYWWIWDDGKDDPTDHCLHGHVVVRIGDEIIEENCTVSSTGLLLLRTLTEDHFMSGEVGNQMLPNHGFNVYAADASLTSVLLDGDPYGTDWQVTHEGDQVILYTPKGTTDRVSLSDYREQVCRFCDEVEAYYQSCQPKRFDENDPYEATVLKPGFTALWNEWHRRRKEAGRIALA